jgi:hypothetical protein
MSGHIRGKIRKITVGPDPINAMACAIDLIVRGLRVVEIVHDKNYLNKTGREKILVIVENKDKIRFIWKEFVDVPFTLEYGDPEGAPEDHV